MSSAWLLPEHIADVLPAQARHNEELRRGLIDVARSYGCELVMPPLLEHIESLLSGAGAGRMLGAPDCTPGYYNNEGRDPGPAARLNVGHPQGATAYFRYLDEWRSSGEFEGLELR